MSKCNGWPQVGCTKTGTHTIHGYSLCDLCAEAFVTQDTRIVEQRLRGSAFTVAKAGDQWMVDSNLGVIATARTEALARVVALALSRSLRLRKAAEAAFDVLEDIVDDTEQPDGDAVAAYQLLFDVLDKAPAQVVEPDYADLPF